MVKVTCKAVKAVKVVKGKVKGKAVRAQAARAKVRPSWYVHISAFPAWHQHDSLTFLNPIDKLIHFDFLVYTSLQPSFFDPTGVGCEDNPDFNLNPPGSACDLHATDSAATVCPIDTSAKNLFLVCDEGPGCDDMCDQMMFCDCLCIDICSEYPSEDPIIQGAMEDFIVTGQMNDIFLGECLLQITNIMTLDIDDGTGAKRVGCTKCHLNS